LARVFTSVGASQLLAVMRGLSRARGLLADRVGAGTPAGPLAPAPGGVQYGAGVGSAAGAGSGLFFFGLAALLAFAALGAPRAFWMLRATRCVGAPQPFLLLLDHPG
jgi:hypothetical protein